jgi:hypothetical protein
MDLGGASPLRMCAIEPLTCTLIYYLKELVHTHKASPVHLSDLPLGECNLLKYLSIPILTRQTCTNSWGG